MTLTTPGARRRGRLKTFVVFATVAVMSLGATPALAAANWADDSSAQSRAEELLAQMTLEEKVGMLHGEINGNYGFYNAPIERLGIPALTMADGPAGVRLANPDVNEGEATAFPAPIAIAASWEADIAEQFGRTAGAEAFSTGHNVLLSPAADIFRDPRAGRGFEAFGEDSLLSGVMAARHIVGIQSNPVLADIKHLSAYNQETNRLIGGNAIVSERAYQEVYNRPIAMAVEGGHPASAMCAFNKINGVWACENAELLTTILRQQMSFAGFVMSDYNATHTTVESFAAGLDQEQPANYHFGDELIRLVNEGTIAMADVDAKVLNVLRPMFALGLFDNPVVTTGFDEVANASTAQTFAERSMVLLKNDNGILPVSEANTRSIAVIGADADTDVAGGGSSLVKGTDSVSPLEGIQARAGEGVTVTYSPGTDPIGNGAALLPGPDVVPSDVLSTDGQPGLLAQYWTNLDRSGDPGITRVEPFAAQNLGFVSLPSFNAQSPKLPETPREYNNEMAATWTSTLTVPVSGSYQFSVGAEGSATLFFDDQPVVTVDQASEFATNTWDVELTEGDTHTVRIEYQHDVATAPDAGSQFKFGWVPPAGFVAAQAKAAADQAAQSDLAVVVVRDLATEGADKPSLALPQGQDDLIRQVSAANPNTVVVLTTGGPVETASWDAQVSALLQAWYAGQEQGDAVARILYGDVNPSGHLPVSFPVDETQMPTSSPEQFPGIGVDTVYSEGIFVGYKGYAERDLTPHYPFGHGLSYTSFDVSATNIPGRVRLGPDGLANADDLRVEVAVTNTGAVAGSHVVQIYAGGRPGQKVDMAERQLAGFTKVDLDPGATTNVTVTLDPKSFALWDEDQDRWDTPRGSVELFLGGDVESASAVGRIVLR
ncbi:MAG TPA: glycoside hydrolase family 3 C-terminal domain-containing protein [Glaciihabitans sp.]|nr:glycoside hydrolase family 3 C-terminal domain-containing protein [Glaciihabitans sp.]